MENEYKAIGLRQQHGRMPDWARVVIPAPSTRRWGWLIFAVAAAGCYVLGIAAGVQIGYQRGIDENPGAIVGRIIVDNANANIAKGLSNENDAHASKPAR